MADRFYSEGSKNNGAAGSDSGATGPRPSSVNPYSTGASRPLGDFSENIDSNTVRPGQGVSASKKFEVHISDFDDFLGMPEPPAAPKAPKPIAKEQKPVARPAEKPAAKPVAKAPASAQKIPLPAKKSSVVKKVDLSALTKKPAKAKKAETKASAPKAPLKKKQAPAKTQAPKRNLTPEQKARIQAKKRYDFIKSVLVACVCVIFVAITTITASTMALQTINDILVIDKDNNITRSVTIEEGMGFNEVFDVLEENGFVKQKTICKLFLLYRKYQTVEYLPGVYYLESNDGLEKNIESMMARKTGSKDTVRLTFPEGWTIAQIFEKLEKYEVCTAEKLYANLDIVAKEYSFISEITPKSGRYLLAEGYLFPDTYDFYIEETPSSVLKKLFSNFEKKWTSEFDERRAELGMTIDEVISIAAMIQREAKNTSQMAVISSVVHNRLNKASTFPTLDMNSTKDYILSLKSYNVFTDFYYDLYLGTYNTYSAQGLPPGPICSPGLAAIRAALYPADTDYYFFMHSPTGEIYLAETADQHQVNTELYL